MKKLVSLFLVLAMCLSLCACGGSEKEAPTEEETLSNEPPAATITDHPLLSNMYGEWILTDTDHPENYPFANVVVHEDGTAIVDGEELIWRIDERYTSDEELALFFYRGSETVVGATYNEAGWFGPLDANGCIYPSSYAYRAIADSETAQAAAPYANAMRLVSGTWVLTADKESAPQEITFQEDYTCTVDGAVYPYAMQPNGNWTQIYILNNGAFLYQARIEACYNEYAVNIQTDNGLASYANPAHYDIIEITPENWMDYFQLADPVYYWEVDAFEEVQSLRGCSYYLQLKEEFNNKLSELVTSGNRLTKNAMEIEFSIGYQACDVDIATQTVTPREGETSFDQQLTETYKVSDNRELGYSCGLISGKRYTEDTSYAEVAYPYDMNLLRADCPLYLIKDEYFYTPE